MLARHINVIGRAGYFFAQHSLSDTGLNGVDHGIIEHVALHPGISQEGLRAHFNKDKSTVAKAMVRLEEAGYVRREANPQNKRENRIYVTHKGRLLVERIQAMKSQWQAILLEGFTPEEREAFLALSARAAKNAGRYLGQQHGE
jgi:DNA-binding MarR family transcriptional regulator